MVRVRFGTVAAIEVVPTRDGGEMPAYVAMPPSGRGPGLIVLQEIFGVTDYIKRRADDLAALGYVVVVPELYWRLGADVTLPENTPEGLQQAFGYMQRMDEPQAVSDAIDALAYARSRPATGGKAGVLGFCLGGRLAYKVAAQAEADPDVLVSYYGSGIAAQLAALDMPTLFHFGAADTFLPVSDAEEIRAHHPDAETHIHDGAGHAFDNPSPMFHHADASRDAWQETAEFLKRTLPPS